jgi:hypothetical protein
MAACLGRILRYVRRRRLEAVPQIPPGGHRLLTASKVSSPRLFPPPTTGTRIPPTRAHRLQLRAKNVVIRAANTEGAPNSPGVATGSARLKMSFADRLLLAGLSRRHLATGTAYWRRRRYRRRHEVRRCASNSPGGRPPALRARKTEALSKTSSPTVVSRLAGIRSSPLMRPDSTSPR